MPVVLDFVSESFPDFRRPAPKKPLLRLVKVCLVKSFVEESGFWTSFFLSR